MSQLNPEQRKALDAVESDALHYSGSDRQALAEAYFAAGLAAGQRARDAEAERLRERINRLETFRYTTAANIREGRIQNVGDVSDVTGTLLKLDATLAKLSREENDPVTKEVFETARRMANSKVREANDGR